LQEVFADNSANAETSAAGSRLNVGLSTVYKWPPYCSIFLPSRSEKGQMALKIEKDSDGRKTALRLNGRLHSERLDELKTQLIGDQSPIVLDLDGVTLVDSQGDDNERIAGIGDKSSWRDESMESVKNRFCPSR
jgi:hypothetical protein